MIVSFSGIDSAGKSTQIALLEEALRKRGKRYTKRWSKARGTPGIVFLKSLVRRDRKMAQADKQEYRAAFFQSTRKKRFLLIASLLDLLFYWGVYLRLLKLFYPFVLCDRYLWDTAVELRSDFAGVFKEKGLLWRTVVFFAPKPRHAFVFVIPAELSIARDEAKHANGIEAPETKKRKIESYQDFVKQYKWNHVMDGTRQIAALHAEVLKTLQL